MPHNNKNNLNLHYPMRLHIDASKITSICALRCSDMSEKTIQNLDVLHKKWAKFAVCLHERDLKIWEVSCCFPCIMFTLHIKLGLYVINHIKTTKNHFHGKLMGNLSWRHLVNLVLFLSKQVKPGFTNYQSRGLAKMS